MAPVAHAKGEDAETFAREAAGLELDDVPAEPAVGDAFGGGGVVAILRLAPERERRQLDAVAVAHFEHGLDARFDE